MPRFHLVDRCSARARCARSRNRLRRYAAEFGALLAAGMLAALRRGPGAPGAADTRPRYPAGRLSAGAGTGDRAAPVVGLDYGHRGRPDGSGIQTGSCRHVAACGSCRNAAAGAGDRSGPVRFAPRLAIVRPIRPGRVGCQSVVVWTAVCPFLVALGRRLGRSISQFDRHQPGVVRSLWRRGGSGERTVVLPRDTAKLRTQIKPATQHDRPVMIFVGIDDTDTLDSPGTNQLVPPSGPATSRSFAGRVDRAASVAVGPTRAVHPQERLRGHRLSADARADGPRSGCDTGADHSPVVPCRERPGLVRDRRSSARGGRFRPTVSAAIRLSDRSPAVGREHGIFLDGLGGTEDGVIGVLAAVGLASLHEQGRIIYLGSARPDIHDVGGWQSVEALHRLGIDEVRRLDSGAPVPAGQVNVGKRLRPNFCQGKIVLFVSPWEPSGPADPPRWLAERVL